MPLSWIAFFGAEKTVARVSCSMNSPRPVVRAKDLMSTAPVSTPCSTSRLFHTDQACRVAGYNAAGRHILYDHCPKTDYAEAADC